MLLLFRSQSIRALYARFGRQSLRDSGRKRNYKIRGAYFVYGRINYTFFICRKTCVHEFEQFDFLKDLFENVTKSELKLPNSSKDEAPASDTEVQQEGLQTSEDADNSIKFVPYEVPNAAALPVEDQICDQGSAKLKCSIQSLMNEEP